MITKPNYTISNKKRGRFQRPLFLLKKIYFLNFKKDLKIKLLNYFNHPALRITARAKNKIRQAQVALFKVDSALLALVNMELPLDAKPPIPSPFGL